MNSGLTRFLGNAASWFTATFTSRIVAAILYFLLARNASLAETGAYTLGVTFLALFMPIMGWGFEHLLIRDVAQDRGVAPRMLRQFLRWRVLLAILAYAAVVVVTLALGYSTETLLVIWLICASLLSDGVSELLQAYWIAIEKAAILVRINLPINLVRLAIGVWLLWNGGGAIVLAAVFLATSVVKCLTFLLLVWSRSALLHAQAGQTSAAPVLSFRSHIAVAAPFMLIDVAWIVEYQIGYVMISLYLGEEAVAIYGSAFAIVSMVVLISYAYMTAVFPIISRLKQIDSPLLQFVYERSCLYMLLIGGFMAAMISVTADDIYRILYPPAFSQGATVLTILMWSQVFVFVHGPVSRVMIVFNEQRALAIFIGLGAVLNILINLVLIPSYGVNGAAIARLLSYTIFFVLNFAYVNRQLMPIDALWLTTRSAAVLVGTTVVVLLLHPSLGLLSIAAGAAVFMGLVVLLRVVTRNDIQVFQHALAPGT
jgi:O-antigen/teichoic acid export membrane protein